MSRFQIFESEYDYDLPEKHICTMCEEEVSEYDLEAREVKYTHNGRRIHELVCGDCFKDPDYRETIMSFENPKIYPFRP